MIAGRIRFSEGTGGLEIYKRETHPIASDSRLRSVGDTKHVNDGFQLAFNYFYLFDIAAQVHRIETSRHW